MSLQSGHRWKVGGCKKLAVDNGKVDLHLVKPTGVDRQVHENQVGIPFLQPFDGTPTAVRRSVIHDPEDTPCATVRLDAHNLVDQTVKGSFAGLGLAASKNPPYAHVQGRQVLGGPAPHVLGLYAGWLPGFRQLGWMSPAARLDTGLLICAEHVLVISERLAVPDPGIQV